MGEEAPAGWGAPAAGAPRASVLVLCAALLAAVLAIPASLIAPVWLRVTGTVLVLAVAVASKLDRLRTKRAEQAEADRKEQQAADEAEKKWLGSVRNSLWRWPLPAVGETDPGN